MKNVRCKTRGLFCITAWSLVVTTKILGVIKFCAKLETRQYIFTKYHRMPKKILLVNAYRFFTSDSRIKRDFEIAAAPISASKTEVSATPSVARQYREEEHKNQRAIRDMNPKAMRASVVVSFIPLLQATQYFYLKLNWLHVIKIITEQICLQ